MRQLDSQEIKQVILDILSVFAEYCDEHGLRYYLCGGTLLGAVRHKGFIPWDDDVDLLMPRPDYDRLHELVKSEPICDHYQLISITAGNSFWPFAKLIDTRTHTDNTYNTNDQWLWIDIFPMDGLPADEKESAKVLSIAAPMKKWFTRSNAKFGEGRTVFKKITKIPMILFLKIINPKTFGRKLDRIARRYSFDDSEFVGGIAWSLGPKERMKKEEYISAVDMEFCGRLFHVPECWDYYLHSIYGDYMQLPPEDQRVNHEFVAFIDE